MDSAVDYGADRLRAMCAAAPLDCQFVDMRGVSMPISGDRIHPTQDVRTIAPTPASDSKVFLGACPSRTL
jgi:hypothetical protein